MLNVIGVSRQIQKRCTLFYGATCWVVRFAGCGMKCLTCRSPSQGRQDGWNVTEETLAKLLADQGGTDKIYLMGGDPLTQQTAEMQKLMNDLLAVGYRRFFVETPLSTSVRWLVRFRESNPSIRLYIIANVLLVSSGMTELSDESNYELLGRHDVLHLICRDQADLDDARTTISRFASAEQPPILQFGASDEQREGWLQDAIMRLDDPMFDRFDIRIL